MHYPKLRELGEAILALFKGPYTSKYPHRPHKAAPRFRGKPEPSGSCIGCKACFEVCPMRAIEVKDNTTPNHATREMIWHLDECHYCGQCELYCTTKDLNPPGVHLTGEYELAGFSRAALVSKTQKLELLLCETCGDVVTTRAHLDWASKRLGPLAYSNPTLFISSLGKIGLADDVPHKAQVETRGDRIKVLCAPCRRKVTQEK